PDRSTIAARQVKSCRPSRSRPAALAHAQHAEIEIACAQRRFHPQQSGVLYPLEPECRTRIGQDTMSEYRRIVRCCDLRYVLCSCHLEPIPPLVVRACRPLVTGGRPACADLQRFEVAPFSTQSVL